MKYVVLVSHGTMAPGLHNALKMLAGEGREDIVSTSLENGMSSETYAENVRKCISGITKDDMDSKELIDALLPEAREALKEFYVAEEKSEDEI